MFPQMFPTQHWLIYPLNRMKSESNMLLEWWKDRPLLLLPAGCLPTSNDPSKLISFVSTSFFDQTILCNEILHFSNSKSHNHTYVSFDFFGIQVDLRNLQDWSSGLFTFRKKHVQNTLAKNTNNCNSRTISWNIWWIYEWLYFWSRFTLHWRILLAFLISQK